MLLVFAKYNTISFCNRGSISIYACKVISFLLYMQEFYKK